MTSLHHVSLLTKDAALNQHFYQQILGFRLVKNTVNQENWHMRHLFYGDYLGTPGTVTTFFAVPHLGPRYDGSSYLNGLTYEIPETSNAFWQNRLTQLHLDFTADSAGLHFKDPDDVAITLQPGADTPIAPERVVENDIPAAHQIRTLLATELHVPDTQSTVQFFQDLNGLTAVPSDGADRYRLPLDKGQYLTIVGNSDTSVHSFGRGSMDHVALTAANATTLTELAEKAKTGHYQIEMQKDRGWFTSLYLKEPNGNRIEYATMTPGFTLDEPLTHLGEHLGLPPFLESKRTQISQYFEPDTFTAASPS